MLTVSSRGTAHHVRLPAGQVTVGGHWRSGPSEPKQPLTPQTIQVDPGSLQPLVIRIP